MAASTGAMSSRSRASSSARRSTPACRRTKAISSRKALPPGRASSRRRPGSSWRASSARQPNRVGTAMMRALVTLCVRHFGSVTALTVLALLLGSWGALHSALDVFPEFVPSQVDIQTEAPGFAPQQVEELVTKPIENAVNGTAGLATLRSESIPGLSVVTITFARNVDVHVARQGIAERLAELGSTLPAGVGTPKLSPLVSSTMDLLKIGLLSDKVDAYTLRDAAGWVIKPRLLAVPGVAHVIVFGGDQRQIQILPDIARLASYNVTISEVADAARTALPLRGAGFIDLASQRILIKSPTPAPDVAALGAAVVTVRNNTPILLRDLAEVKMAPALRFGDALIMGKPGVLLSLASQYGANTLATTLAVERALAALEPALRAQGLTLYPELHRPANFIQRALGNLQAAPVLASLMVAMTSTPALCALLLRRHDERPEADWLQRLKSWQRWSVERVSRHLKVSILVLIGLVIAALGALPFLGGTFMPDFREGHFVMQVSSSITGTSLEQMLALGKRVSTEVLALPYVKSIEQQIGRAELSEDTWGPHRSEFHVELKPDAKVNQEAAQQGLR